MFNFKRIGLIVAALCMFGVVSIAGSRPATTKTIDYPGATDTLIFGINPAGDIVGAFYDTLGAEHGFLLRKGEFTSFDVAGADFTEAYGINPQGDIVGQYGWYDSEADSYTTQGFLLRDGDFYPVAVEGQQNTMPFKINPDGMIVGCNHFNGANPYSVNIATMTGFSMYLNGSADHTPVRTMNQGVNPDGDIVGFYYATPLGIPSGRPETSYLIKDGVTTFFQYPGAFATLATDINAAGSIVGRYRPGAGLPFHGFILRAGVFQSFDVPDATNTFPYGINSNGTIVGYYFGASGVYHGFLMSSATGKQE